MTHSIEAATSAHLPEILAIHNAAVESGAALYDHHPRTPEAQEAWWQAKQASGLPVWVALGETGKVCGYATWGPFRPQFGFGRTAEHSLYVHEEARGQGLGNALLHTLLHEAKRADLFNLIGVIDSENEASLRLHERHGFARVGTLPRLAHKHGRWLNTVLVVRQLQEGPPPAHGEA